jgi:hypothetical protein
MSGVYRAALALAAKGVPVFPCAPSGKAPLTHRGLYDASTDPAQVASWERWQPSANLGVPTGFRSGLLVVDVDCKAGVPGIASLQAAERLLGALPSTLVSFTPSGGQHRWFTMPAIEIRNSAGKLGDVEAPGVDIRAEGGYVIAPPSSIDGRPYAWAERHPVAELPAGWVDALRRKERPPVQSWEPRTDRERSRAETWCVRALQNEARDLAFAPGGTRNDRLWRAAAALGGLIHIGAIDAEDVRRALTWAANHWGSRTPRKDRATLERGLAFGRAHPRNIDLEEDRAA